MSRPAFGMDEECTGMSKEDPSRLNEYHPAEPLSNISAAAFKISGCDLLSVNGVNLIHLFLI